MRLRKKVWDVNLRKVIMFEAELVNDIEELVYESEDFKLYRIVKENDVNLLGSNVNP